MLSSHSVFYLKLFCRDYTIFKLIPTAIKRNMLLGNKDELLFTLCRFLRRTYSGIQLKIAVQFLYVAQGYADQPEQLPQAYRD